MGHSTDDRRALAEIERRLVRDDPALDKRMTTLNAQFPQDLGPPGSHALDPGPDPGHHPGPSPDAGSGRPRASRRKVVLVVLAVIALLGLLLTAFLGAASTPSDGADTGPAALGVSASADPAT
ncbi:DUF3040 domain-containing protein [Streptomyces sp. NPDC101160]|uniref:DUF3040 domain-containing protein n=1 Tax=Streptomyces sp. NPDC101160 TaxID=3366118 RepID=UPI0038087EBB